MGESLPSVFNFWLSQISKFIDVLKQVPVFKDVSLFHVIIGVCAIGVFLKIIKFGLSFNSIHSTKMYNRSYTEERRN